MSGKIPFFGYPMMSFSPPDNGHTLTDRKAWRVAMLGNGKLVRQENHADVEYISSVISNSKIKAAKEASPRQLLRERAGKSPAGAKCHLYKESSAEYDDSYITKWKEIHKGIGLGQG